MRLFIYLAAYLSITFSGLFAEIIEVAHFQEIENYLSNEMLVVFDIDDTLLIPTQTLGTDVWFRYRVEQHLKKNHSYKIAFEKALAEWEAIRHLTEVKIVETGSQKIIAKMQDQNIPIIGLTTQGLALATRTVQQLLSLEVDLSKTAPSKKDHYFINQQGVLFRHGILFTAGTNKGIALLTLCDLIDIHPKKILFINDKESHLKEVEAVVLANEISFIGLRYNFRDEEINNFSEEIATIQWKYSTFDHLLTDEEAKNLLKLEKNKLNN